MLVGVCWGYLRKWLESVDWWPWGAFGSFGKKSFYGPKEWKWKLSKDGKHLFALLAQNSAKHRVVGTFVWSKTPRMIFRFFGPTCSFWGVVGAKSVPETEIDFIYTWITVATAKLKFFVTIQIACILRMGLNGMVTQQLIMGPYLSTTTAC